MTKSVAIEWKRRPVEGTLEISNGAFVKMNIAKGEGNIQNAHFSISSDSPCRLEIEIGDARLSPGSNPTMVTVRTKDNPFTFFLRDVNSDYPIFIPEYGVTVVPSKDSRSYQEIERDILKRGLLTNLQRIAIDEEESYEEAAIHTRKQHCPTWLGLSRDMRIFEVDYSTQFGYWGNITPRFHGYRVTLPETDNTEVSYNFVIGRGSGCVVDITRCLESGCLPILHSTVKDEEVIYNITTFVTLEKSPLTQVNLCGTHYLVADGHGHGHMFTEEQKKVYESLLPEEMERDEETVLFFRGEALNTSSVPRYAWFKNVLPVSRGGTTLDGSNGFASFASGRVYCISRLNGEPLIQEEISVLLKPGECATFEFFLPHRPIPKERAEQLAKVSFEDCRKECHNFWFQKLSNGTQLNLPEQRIDEMARAGLLHLDVVAYGREPEGTIAATIGVYCPIGSESSPIIQFFDSMGWHDVARRSLMYFLDKQHDDGFIQNFGGYMLETGAALWSMGEHYRYTRDDAWVRQIATKLIKSCDFLIDWRNRNKREEFRGKGYGMIEGKVGDPEDPYRQFMLNGYACLGIMRVAEMLEKFNPDKSKQLQQEALEWKKDIRAALFEGLAKSPVVPLGDGTWCPTVPPWAGYRGPVSLQAEGGNWFSHGSVACRDSLVGPLYLILQGMIEPYELVTDFMLKFHNELFCIRNTATSQPYYSRHPYAHLKRGEVKAFLKAHYNTFSGLADRETYTFWEHFFFASPHKTHEEGWFLMQIRWMLYMEEGQTLKLLSGIPRVWLENGKKIGLNNVASYFGPVSLQVQSKLEDGLITAVVECNTDRQPSRVELRLPHPQGKKAVSVRGGSYDADKEVVVIEDFRNKEMVTVKY